jgi:tartrate-resistant acid phosphatase type 5
MKAPKVFSLFLLLVVSACRPAPPEYIPSASFTPSPPPSSTPTATATFTPTVTHTPTETPVPVVRFAVIGDFGLAGDDLAAVAALIDSWEVDFIITTGDNNYPNGSAATIDENIGQYFHEYIFPYKGAYGDGAERNRFFPSLGNHDWYTQDAQPYLDYFELPGNERYYAFNWDFIDFFVLDSEWSEPDGIGRTSLQAEWLQEGLGASQAVWQVVYFHLTPYSSGYNGPTTHMRWPFKEWGADVVLAGHDHHYERLEIDGLTYFVNGLGGGPRYPIGEAATGSQIRYRARHGAMLVEATPSRMEFSFINIDGEVIDTFILERQN